MQKARLVLQDGTVFIGEAIGHRGTTTGEVVFHTAMTGYETILTDPSCRGQIVLLTYPLIGNRGVADEDSQSGAPHVRGLIVREQCIDGNGRRGERSLDEFLRSHSVVGIQRIDTRALTRKLRESGTMKGIISSERVEADGLIDRMRREPDYEYVDFVDEVSVGAPYEVSPDSAGSNLGAPHVVVLDFGVRRDIVGALTDRGCRVTVVPASYSVDDIDRLEPSAVVLSNGPGDPTRIPYAVRTARGLIGRFPLFGISLGHQVLGLALGGSTYKLKHGHRGANQPVQSVRDGKVTITSQNHGYAVDENSLDGTVVEVTHRNLNDGTVEGLRHRDLPIASVQFDVERASSARHTPSPLDVFIAANVSA